MEHYGLTWEQVDNLGLIKRSIMLGANYSQRRRQSNQRRQPVNASEWIAKAKDVLNRKNG